MNTENFRIGSGDLLVNDVSIGATTQEGVVVTYEPDVHLHLSGKYGSTPVKASLIGQKLTIKIVMEEVTADNMEIALAGSVSADDKVKFGGVAGREITGVELKLVPFDGTESWVFRNAVPTSPVEVAYQPNNERVYSVTFTALVDESFPEAESLAYVS
jgi:hypothetical protein